jgi:hypothetical protein
MARAAPVQSYDKHFKNKHYQGTFEISREHLNFPGNISKNSGNIREGWRELHLGEVLCGGLSEHLTDGLHYKQESDQKISIILNALRYL